MLDKAINHGKEYRSPYRGAKAIDRSCRNHGACSYCKDNRTYNTRRRRAAALQQLEDYFSEYTEERIG